MRSSAFSVMAALALTAGQAPSGFRLDRVANHPSATPAEVSIRVTTNGPPPPDSVLTEAGRWTITVKGPGNTRLAPQLSKPASYDPVTGVITLTVPRAPFGAADPAKCAWQVTFRSVDNRLNAAQDPAVSDAFALGSVSGSVGATQVRVRVRASGIPPSGDVVTNGAYWRVQVSDSHGNRKAIQPVDQAQYRSKAGSVFLTFPASKIGSIKASDASWTAAFLAPDTTLTSAPDGGKTGALGQAKSRDDADLYVSGTYIAGVGTKPIWGIDAKAGYSDAPEKVPVVNWLVKSSPPNLRFGIYGEMTTNPDTQAPVDRTQVDPDSIAAYTTLFQTVRLPQNAFFYGLKWEVQPVGGEFSRKYPASNLISGGRVRFVKVLAAQKRWGADLIPSLGFEGGKNLNKPGVLFMRPVDLHAYNAIARLRAGADANLYWFRRVSTPNDTYAFTLNGSWVARVPFTAEPFTTTAYLPDPTDATMITRQQVVAMRKNTRHYVKVDAAWNVTKLFGLQAEYKYGSLPPLFEFVSHQVSVGLLFKATYQKNHSVASPLP
jgi:hypothetical protein